MHLKYSGKKRTIRKVVNRANRILISPFFLQQLKETRITTDNGVWEALIQKINMGDKQDILVLSYWNPLKSVSLHTVGATKIYINRARLKYSKRSLLSVLLEKYTLIQLSSLDSSDQQFNQEELVKKVGILAKGYM